MLRFFCLFVCSRNSFPWDLLQLLGILRFSIRRPILVLTAKLKGEERLGKGVAGTRQNFLATVSRAAYARKLVSLPHSGMC